MKPLWLASSPRLRAEVRCNGLLAEPGRGSCSRHIPSKGFLVSVPKPMEKDGSLLQRQRTAISGDGLRNMSFHLCWLQLGGIASHCQRVKPGNGRVPHCIRLPGGFALCVAQQSIQKRDRHRPTQKQSVGRGGQEHGAQREPEKESK